MKVENHLSRMWNFLQLRGDQILSEKIAVSSMSWGLKKSDKKWAVFHKLRSKNVGNDLFTSKISNKWFPRVLSEKNVVTSKKHPKGMNFTILRYNDPTDPTFQTPYFLVGCATGPRLMKGGPRVFPVWKVWMLSEVMINQWLLRFCGILWIFKECSCYLVLARNSLKDKVLADDLSLSQCISRIDLFW